MKILNVEWKAFANDDIKDAFRAEGHSIVEFPFSKEENARHNSEAEERLSVILHRETPNVVFSFNFFPFISKICNKEHIPYISWVYDCPHVRLYSYTVINPCNSIFVFDKELYQEFHNAGIHTVHYLPLAANTERLDAMEQNSKLPYLYDISLVGALYTEVYRFFGRMDSLSNYAKGYLEGLMAA